MAVTQVCDYRIRCDHAGCGRQLFVTADDLDHAVRRALATFGWQGNRKRIVCTDHKAASGG